MPLCTAARCSSKIESGRNDCLTRDHPAFGIKRLVFFKLGNNRSDPIHHVRCGEVKPVFDVAFPVGWRECQFTHDNDQIPLYRENLVRNKFIWRNGTSEPQGSRHFIDAPACVNTRVAFRNAMSVHQRGFAFVASFCDDGHGENCRGFLRNANPLDGVRHRTSYKPD